MYILFIIMLALFVIFTFGVFFSIFFFLSFISIENRYVKCVPNPLQLYLRDKRVGHSSKRLKPQYRKRMCSNPGEG